MAARKKNRVGFYCRMNHRNHDYSQFFDEVQNALEKRYGKKEWRMIHFFEIASGADPWRKEFGRLKQEVAAGKIDVVISVRPEMLARDWTQFIAFMELCESRHVDVVCSNGETDAEALYQRIKLFKTAYFGMEEVAGYES